jgi:hypothetical protein
MPAFINDNSTVSIIISEASFVGRMYKSLVREIQGAQHKDLKKEMLPAGTGEGSAVPLYVGRKKG